MAEPILIVAPSWVGDAILSEPLVAILREPMEEPTVDVLAPPWCAPVYARMRGVRNIIENPIGHRELRLGERRALARTLRGNGYARALVLPNSFKSALIPWMARIPRRIGYVGEARGMLLTDARRLDVKALPRLVDRFVALAAQPGELVPTSAAPVARPRRSERRPRQSAPSALARIARWRSCVPAPSTARPSAGRPSISLRWRGASSIRGTRSGCSARPTTAIAADPVAAAIRRSAQPVRQNRSGHGDRSAGHRQRRGQQRFRPDACRGGGRTAAGRAVRLVEPRLHAAAVAARACRQDRDRVQPVLPARMPARTFQMHARAGAECCV